MTELHVELGQRSYPIMIGAGAFELALAQMEKLKACKRKAVCIADSAVLEAHPEKAVALGKSAEVIGVRGGESSKSFEKLGELCSRLAQLKADRKTCVFALGGGVIGDLSGFAAAVYMRGIDFFQIPTTLLAMVDSSVGGKTGINIAEGKNLVGAFHQPDGVFADTEFLKTLPPREFAAGMAEVIKCAVLGDAEFFYELEKQQMPLSPSHPYLPAAILKSCELKARVVAADERETSASGGRALLNLGHTFGHAIENCAGYGHYLHGEAVAIGMVMAARFSQWLGKIGGPDVERIARMISASDLPVALKAEIPAEDLLEAMTRDKKAHSGRLRFVLINAIGETETEDVGRDAVLQFLKDFLARK